LTPEEFLKIYKNIYKFDEDILKTKRISFVLTSLFLIIDINNITSVYVFSQKKLRAHKFFNWHLHVASIFKLVFCFTLLVDFSFSNCFKESIFSHELNEAATKLIDFILLTADSSISYSTIFLTLDRWQAIKNPMQISEFITNLHAKCLIDVSLSVLIFLKILNLIICEFRISTEPHVIFCTIISPSIFNVAPLIMILTVNTLLVLEVLKYYRNQNKKNNDWLFEQAIELKDLNSTNKSIIVRKVN
jgi:hypothetical protein